MADDTDPGEVSNRLDHVVAGALLLHRSLMRSSPVSAEGVVERGCVLWPGCGRARDRRATASGAAPGGAEETRQCARCIGRPTIQKRGGSWGPCHHQYHHVCMLHEYRAPIHARVRTRTNSTAPTPPLSRRCSCLGRVARGTRVREGPGRG